ncbi:type II toxin-antitoxin system HicB family antitoxin [Ruegeria arenilitoris]|uniref:type II toxin-antitoxin system HicB family antitoxin n=1 Tax=Ruegeria arenilitoris TaxID=1173585 RepID=UPI001CFCDC32
MHPPQKGRAYSAYDVCFPDVPNCFAAADESGDVIENAISALDYYFSDLDDLRVARDLQAIRVEVAEELTEGAICSLSHSYRTTQSRYART